MCRLRALSLPNFNLFHKHLVIASHVCGVAIQFFYVVRTAHCTEYTKTAPDGRSFVSRILWFLLDTDAELVAPAGNRLTTNCALYVIKSFVHLILFYHVTGYQTTRRTQYNRRNRVRRQTRRVKRAIFVPPHRYLEPILHLF